MESLPLTTGTAVPQQAGGTLKRIVAFCLTLSAGALLGCGRGAVLGGGVAARPQLAPTPIRGPWEGIDAPLVGVACGRARVDISTVGRPSKQ